MGDKLRPVWVLSADLDHLKDENTKHVLDQVYTSDENDNQKDAGLVSAL